MYLCTKENIMHHPEIAIVDPNTLTCLVSVSYTHLDVYKRQTFNGFRTGIHFLLYDSSLALRIECILNQNRNILMTYRIHSRRINHLRSKVTKLHRFHIAQLINGIGLSLIHIYCPQSRKLHRRTFGRRTAKDNDSQSIGSGMSAYHLG